MGAGHGVVNTLVSDVCVWCRKGCCWTNEAAPACVCDLLPSVYASRVVGCSRRVNAVSVSPCRMRLGISGRRGALESSSIVTCGS